MSDSGSESARHHPYKTRAPSRAGTPPGLTDSDLLVYAALKELMYLPKYINAILALPPGSECNELARLRRPSSVTSMAQFKLFNKVFPPSHPTTPEKRGVSIPTDPITPTPQRIATPNPASSYEIVFDNEEQQSLYKILLEGMVPHPLAFFILDGPEETVVDRIVEQSFQLTRAQVTTLTGLFPSYANYLRQKRDEAMFMQRDLISPQPDLVPVEDVFSAYPSPAPQPPALASPAQLRSPVRRSQSAAPDVERATRRTPSPIARIDDEDTTEGSDDIHRSTNYSAGSDT